MPRGSFSIAWCLSVLMVSTISQTIVCPGAALANANETANAKANVAAQSPIKDKWALVVGISSFANPSLNLKYAAKDATDFRNFLVNECNFAQDHVRLLTNEQATSTRILDELGDSWLPRVAMPDDLVVVFISSHGSPADMDVRGVNYVVGYDTNPEKLFTTGIPLQHLANTIKERIHSDRVVVILDACHSGAASDAKGLTRPSNVDATEMAQGTGQLVICSSTKNEVSWESKQYPNSVFTRTLIDALKKDGTKTKLGDALTYLKDEVPRQVLAERGTMQTPVVEKSKWHGHDLLLAAVPTAPRPGLAVSRSITPAAAISSPPAAAAPAASSTNNGPPPGVIPQVAGDWIGTNGVEYHIWQKGRSTGWEMPEISEYGRGTISEDGKTSVGFWYGPITGHGTATLEVDEAGRVIKMIGDDGCVFTRIESGKKKR